MPEEKSVEIVPDKKKFRELEDQVLSLTKTVEASYLDMGKALFEIQEIFGQCDGNPELSKKVLGFETFDLWVSSKMGYDPRKAYYILSVWKSLHIGLGIPKRELERIGWTKARELVPLVSKDKLTKDNSDTWIERARDLSTEELKTKVKKAIHGPEKEGIHRVGFTVFDGQLENIKAALETAAEVTGSDKPGHLLDSICLEYNGAHIRGQDSKSATIHRICAKLEELYGVKVIVIDGDKALYGEKEVKEALAQEPQKT